MGQWNRRRFISTAAVAAGGGLAGWQAFGSRGLLAQAPLAGVPDEILNPVEVSGAEAEPVIGKLPGQKRMYVLPANAGEYHRVGGLVMKRIARPADTGDVHELATFTGNTGAAVPRHAHLEQPCRRARHARRSRVRARGRSLDDDARRFREPAAGDAARVDDAIRRRADCPVLDEPSRRRGLHGHG